MSQRWCAAVFLAVGAIQAAPLQAQEPTIPLVDEAWRDPALVLARHDVLVAAARRDTAALRPLIAPNFLWSFGGGDLNDFMQHLSAAPDTWEAMVEVMSLGGRLSAGGGEFRAPFYTTDDSCVESAPRPTTADAEEDREGTRFSCDGFEVLIVLGMNVRVRRSPGGEPIDAVTLGYVSLDRSRPHTRTPDGVEWTPVFLRNGGKGWIASRLLRSPIGWRAGFTKGADGKWRLTTFVAGD